MFISSKDLGEEIKKLRKQFSLSQKDLAEGICTQAAISSIELGRTFPSIDILYAISIKLHFSIDQLIKELSTTSYLYIQETMSEIDRLVKLNDYKEVFEITKLNLKNHTLKTLGNEFNQYIRWHNILSSYYINQINYKQCINELEELIDVQQDYLLKQSYQDLKIKNVIGNILTQNKQYKKATIYYQDILSKNIKIEGYYKLKLKVYFNLSKLMFLRSEYQMSTEIAHEGILLSIKQEDISVLPNLFVQFGQSLSMLADRDPVQQNQVLEYYTNAINLYKVLQRQWYVDFINKELIPILPQVNNK
ncbi:helix-turn-helix domain-containing protein [Alkalihalobacillus pseudalcaliphilus]|uniref:helix-turn-helix domain-containing protein n=1 Tax=Alkalihalobacillus pseudalcaliphilus TaxID=79884 RepID=UPI00064DF409|nr:helix-turn-helix domain-containing protein [Alkalihalobacillus pseudalcaliphilus]KMK76747.1 hypothetical protein AB990_07475 [Alkalihalobacillus pseudalcaliphilus]